MLATTARALPRTGPDDDPVHLAVVSAVAGVRRGDPVAVVGAGPRTAAILLAAAESDALVDVGAKVVVAGAPYDVAAAAVRLAPGGRLVAPAADRAAAARVAASHGLELRHVQPVGRRVVWSAVKPVDAPPT